MVVIRAKKISWLYWPFKEKTFLKYQKAASILLRIKVMSVLLIIVAAFFYIELQQKLIAFAMLFGGGLSIIMGFVYYHLIKTGKVKYTK